jgi:hypothetical protein
VIGRASTLAVALASLVCSAAVAQTRMVVVSGLAGEPRFAGLFHSWAGTMVDAARTKFGVPDSAIVWLAEDPAKAPGKIAARSTREAIGAALAATAAKMSPRERLLLVFIGHGSAGETPRLALPGPDLTAADLAKMLAAFGERDMGIVLAASASGDFIPALSGPRRVVITATKSGMEGNETRFPQHFVDAFTRDGADRDKDGRVSLLEAFTYSVAEVRREYEDDSRLLTEHALLDDDGDRTGSAKPGEANTDGRLARSFALGGGRAAVSSDPALAALEGEKRDLEGKIESLRARKAQMEAKAYDDALESLMVELAGVSRKIREKEGRP